MMNIVPLLLLCAGGVFASGGPDELHCTNCEYSIGGIGYLPVNGSCVEFLQCIQSQDGLIEKALLCCPPYTRWDQDVKNCVHGDCDDSRDRCPTYPNVNDTCYLSADPEDQQKFFNPPSNYSQWCPAGTVFRQINCTCVHGPSTKMCYSDPLLHFPYAYDFDDIQCPKAAGTQYGNAEIVKEGGYMTLDGDGDYMTFAYLNNYFVQNKPDDLLVSLWFKQTDDGYNNVFNLFEGLFANGNCDEPQTISLTLKDYAIHGGIGHHNGPQFFSGDATESNRGYAPPNVWCHVAIRYSAQYNTVTLFLNGLPIDQRYVSDFWGTMSDSSVGLAYKHCVPYFFTGCIDDVMVFVRYVSDAEVSRCVFANGRTGPQSEKMYECPGYEPTG